MPGPLRPVGRADAFAFALGVSQSDHGTSAPGSATQLILTNTGTGKILANATAKAFGGNTDVSANAVAAAVHQTASATRPKRWRLPMAGG